jgi:hypothetical protein
MADRMSAGIQERLESSPLGRGLISGMILFVAVVLIGANLPDAPIKERINRVVHPMRDLVGLDQYWGVFAPNPRGETWAVHARIRYGDGSVASWSPPTADAFIGEYRSHRWVKYAENVFQMKHQVTWPDLALWLVRTYDRPEHHPVQIELIRRWYDLNPPGSKVMRGPWQERTFYVLPVTPQALREATRP